MAPASSMVSDGKLIHGQLLGPSQLLISAGHLLTKKVVGPAAARLCSTPALMPCTAADIAVTTNTPTAMPSTVSPARTLFARMASKAMMTPSPSAWSCVRNRMSLRPQCGDRIEARGATRGVRAGHDAYARPERDSDSDRPGGDARRQRRCRGDDVCQAGTEADAEHGADDAERRGLDQKLRHDVPL